MCAILMKNRGLRKWLPIGTGLLVGSHSEPSPLGAGGREREGNWDVIAIIIPQSMTFCSSDRRPRCCWRGKPNRTLAHPGLPGSANGSVHSVLGLGLKFPSEGAKNSATTTSFEHVGGKAQPDSELFPLAPAFSIPKPTCRSRDWGGHPFQAHTLVSSPNKLKL